MTSSALPNAISVRNVRMSYPAPRSWLWGRAAPPPVHALRDVSFDVPHGGRVAVFGENGAGKTTLLKLIAGVLVGEGGQVVIGGGGADRRTPLRTGYVTNDERSFYWRLSGFENLRFFAALGDHFGADARRKIENVLERVGLSSSADRPVGQYSTGMRQRLALARGLLLDPEILLLDEPTRSLDPVATSELLALLREVTKDRTLLVATNRFEDAAALCHEALVLRDGRIVAKKHLSDGFDDPSLASFVREHLGATVRPVNR